MFRVRILYSQLVYMFKGRPPKRGSTVVWGIVLICYGESSHLESSVLFQFPVFHFQFGVVGIHEIPYRML